MELNELIEKYSQGGDLPPLRTPEEEPSYLATLWNQFENWINQLFGTTKLDMTGFETPMKLVVLVIIAILIIGLILIARKRFISYRNKKLLANQYLGRPRTESVQRDELQDLISKARQANELSRWARLKWLDILGKHSVALSATPREIYFQSQVISQQVQQKLDHAMFSTDVQEDDFNRLEQEFTKIMENLSER